MTARRALSVILLVLALASSSVTMAVARHQPRAIGSVQLCTGNGLVHVAVDAQGQPTGPLMPCPDATLALAALTNVSAPVLRISSDWAPAEFQTLAHPVPLRRIPSFRHARAPPVSA